LPPPPSKVESCAVIARHVPRKSCGTRRARRSASGGRSPALASARHAPPRKRAVCCRPSCADVAAHFALRAARLFAARRRRAKRRLAPAARQHRSALKLRGLISHQPSTSPGVAAPLVSFPQPRQLRSAASRPQPGQNQSRSAARRKPPRRTAAIAPCQMEVKFSLLRRSAARSSAAPAPEKVGSIINVEGTNHSRHRKTRVVLNRGQRTQNTLYNTLGVAQEGKFRHKTGGSHCTEMRENL